MTNCKRCDTPMTVPTNYTGKYPLCSTCRRNIGMVKYVEKTVATTRLGYIQKAKPFAIPLGVMLQQKPTR